MLCPALPAPAPAVTTCTEYSSTYVNNVPAATGDITLDGFTTAIDTGCNRPGGGRRALSEYTSVADRLAEMKQASELPEQAGQPGGSSSRSLLVTVPRKSPPHAAVVPVSSPATPAISWGNNWGGFWTFTIASQTASATFTDLGFICVGCAQNVENKGARVGTVSVAIK